MLILTAANKVDPVLVALCINLAKHPSNAQQMADNSRLHSLMARAFQYQDAILMKMIHNISEHDVTRSSFIVSLRRRLINFYLQTFVFV